MTTIDSSADAYTSIDDLSVELADGVLSVTLNRPDSLNSLTAAMLKGIARRAGAGRGRPAGQGRAARLEPAAAFPRVRESARRTTPTPARAAPRPTSSTRPTRAVRSIVNLPQPVVAVVQGPAAGVGASLALACDVVLASEKAFFMLAFTKIGLMPDGGASALIAASVGRHRAMRMALLAERIPAAEAYEWGLVTAVYPADQLDAEVDKVVATLASGPVAALRKTKHAINAATLVELEAALEREKQGQLVLLESNDFREGTRAFQQRRAAKFTDS